MVVGWVDIGWREGQLMGVVGLTRHVRARHLVQVVERDGVLCLGNGKGVRDSGGLEVEGRSIRIQADATPPPTNVHETARSYDDPMHRTHTIRSVHNHSILPVHIPTYMKQVMFN